MSIKFTPENYQGIHQKEAFLTKLQRSLLASKSILSRCNRASGLSSVIGVVGELSLWSWHLFSNVLILLRWDKELFVPVVKGYSLALIHVFSHAETDLSNIRESSKVLKNFEKVLPSMGDKTTSFGMWL